MIICLDYGGRYVGVAATDRDDKLTLRHSVIDQKEENDVLGAIEELVEKEEVNTVVVGVPIGMSGEETAQTRETLDFIGELKLKLGKVKVEGIDERLTSIQAGQNIQAEGGKKEDEHMEAARLMLESYLITSSREG